MADTRLCVDNKIYKLGRQRLAELVERFIDDPETQIRFEKLLRPYVRYYEIGLPHQHKALLAIETATQDDLIKFGFWSEVSRLHQQVITGTLC